MRGRGRGRSRTEDPLGPVWPDGIIGRSAAIQALRRSIERVGSTEATVLILGERGTGKELVAQALAAASGRRARPFVAINCAALPLGSWRGSCSATSGAPSPAPRSAGRGWSWRRRGGTVFLDEVGDLAPAGQAMLLRVLQEREVRPLGATATVGMDVRACDRRDQPPSGARRRRRGFRADLFDRLSEVTLAVPPLRERIGDLPLLAEHFLGRHANRHSRPVPHLSAEVLAWLARQDWPGNVRELEQAMSRAVIFSEGGRVRRQDLESPQVPDRLPSRSDRREGFTDRRERPARLSMRQQEILRIASAQGSIRRRNVRSRFGFSREAARRELVALATLGLLRRTGRNRGARYLLEEDAR